MPINPEFYKELEKKEKQHTNEKSGDGHYVWGEGTERELDFAGVSAHDKELIEKHISEKGYLGIHGTTVAVDFDLCVSDGSCISACPVMVFGWHEKPDEGPTSNGPGNNASEYDKSDPFAENTCIFCMACETVCPTSAIKIQEGLKDSVK